MATNLEEDLHVIETVELPAPRELSAHDCEVRVELDEMRVEEYQLVL